MLVYITCVLALSENTCLIIRLYASTLICRPPENKMVIRISVSYLLYALKSKILSLIILKLDGKLVNFLFVCKISDSNPDISASLIFMAKIMRSLIKKKKKKIKVWSSPILTLQD